MSAEKVDCLILGSGPAGYTAAIYAARAGFTPVMYHGIQPGGQLTTTNDVENFPGYPNGINGPQMMEELQAQAERFGTKVRLGIATSVKLSDKEGGLHEVTIDNSIVITTHALIIATGATAKYLGLPSEQKFLLNGGGVSACAICDGFFYKGKIVAVVGGGDSAAEEATYLAKICKKVYVIIRKDYFRASKIMEERVHKTENIEVLLNSVTEEVLGDEFVTGMRIKNTQEGKSRDFEIDGFFVAIGHKPNTDIFKGMITLDEAGYIKTVSGSTKTNYPGVFAAGDVQDRIYRQAVTAAGTGCMAALDAERYLQTIE